MLASSVRPVSIGLIGSLAIELYAHIARRTLLCSRAVDILPIYPHRRHATTMPVKATDVKPGTGLIFNDQLHVVIETEHVKPGKGPAYVQAKMKNIMTGTIKTNRMNSSDKFETANIDKRDMEFLYDSSGIGDGPFVFMDMETYDQIEIAADIVPAEKSKWLKENLLCCVHLYESNPLQLVLPMSIELTIKETTPQPKGATATNQLKEAIVETGAIVRVPPFIENGQMIKVNPETGEYLGKV